MRYWLCLGAAVIAAACNPLSTGPRAPLAAEDMGGDVGLDALLRSDPAIAALVDDAGRRKLQVLIAVPREDESGKPTLRRLGFRVDAEYFYPASAVKLAVAVAAAQKLDDLQTAPSTRMRTLEREGTRTKTVDTTLADEMERSLVVSDNEANNRLFELVGRDELAERISGMGLPSTHIVHRLGDPGEHKSYAFELAPEGKDAFPVAQRIGFETHPVPIDGLLVGTSYVDESGRLVSSPMSFANKNRMSLRDLQDLLIAVMRPELSDSIDLRLTPRTRNELVALLGMLPSESSRFRYPRALDDVNKPLLGAISAALPGDRVRVYGKGGRAYGFTVECSYVVDETSGRSAFVAAVVYANDNGTLNDDRYQYEDVADPFIARLGKLVARSLLMKTPVDD